MYGIHMVFVRRSCLDHNLGSRLCSVDHPGTCPRPLNFLFPPDSSHMSSLSETNRPGKYGFAHQD